MRRRLRRRWPWLLLGAWLAAGAGTPAESPAPLAPQAPAPPRASADAIASYDLRAKLDPAAKTVDGSLRLPEGSQLVEKGITTNPAYGPVPMQGFVTSSYHSAALGRSFALALIKNGRNRIGETLVAAAGDQLVDVVVADGRLGPTRVEVGTPPPARMRKRVRLVRQHVVDAVSPIRHAVAIGVHDHAVGDPQLPRVRRGRRIRDAPD